MSSYQAVSGSGLAGVRALLDQVKEIGDDAEKLVHDGSVMAPGGFPAPTLRRSRSTRWPMAGNFVDDGSGETDEEQKLRNESRKIFGHPRPARFGTCVRVPVLTGHTMTVHAESRTRSPLRSQGSPRGSTWRDCRGGPDPTRSSWQGRSPRGPHPPGSVLATTSAAWSSLFPAITCAVPH